MSKKPRLLIVEDEESIRTGLIDVFVYHGYEVEFAADGQRGLQLALNGQFDLVLLDVMLPKKNGFDVCEAIRASDPHQPIIMLTAKTTDEDIISGLKLGADDYVAKPFSIAQLVARVEAVLRRSQLAQPKYEQLILPTIEIDALNLCGQRGDETVSFTRREMDILLYLAGHSERPVPREELLSKVWGYRNTDIETRTVDIHIAKLRRKIEAVPAEPTTLVTVRGAGYRLLIGAQ